MKRVTWAAARIAMVAPMLLCCSRSHADAPAIQVGSDFRKMDALECTLKAIEAMGFKQNFIHAEINGPDAWGYDEKSFVMVHTVPIRDGVEIFVAAFSPDNREAERLRNAVREHVFNGSLRASRLPIKDFPKVYRTADANRRRGPLMVHWGNFHKVATEPVFQSCARGAMAHHGLQEHASGTQIIFGHNRTAAVLALGVGLPRGTQAIVIAASDDSNEAERLRNEVRTAIVGCSSL
jgi:hypothetical protein